MGKSLGIKRIKKEAQDVLEKKGNSMETGQPNVSCEYCNHRTNSMVYETQGSMPHSQGISNNPYPWLNQPNSSY